MAKKIRKHPKNVRAIVSIIIAVLLVGLISYLGVKTYQDSHAASGSSIYVNPGSGTLTAGSNVSITVRENSGSDAVNSVQVSLNYDSNALQYTGMVEGGTFPVVAATSTSTPGVIRVGRATENTVTGDKPVVTVNFKVIGTSGTGAITVDKAYSFLVRGSDSTDILQSVGNGSYTFTGAPTPPAPSPSPTPTPTPPGSSSQPVLYISPASGSYAVGSTIAAKVKLNSYATSTTTVEPVISYPADKLEYQGVTEGGVFTTQQRTKYTNGNIDIIRGIAGGGGGINGDNTVVTVNFKVLASSGAAKVTFANGSAVYDTSGTGSNVLNLSGSSAASYTLTGTGQGSNPTPPPSGGGSTGGGQATVTSPSQAVSVSGGSDGHVSLSNSGNGAVTEIKGKVSLAPATTMAADGTSGMDKVEYYLDKKLIATVKTAPYTYNFDSTKLRNGEYMITVKTYFSNGTVDTKSDKLSVHNKVDFSYVMRQYAPSAGLLIAVLVACAFVVIKLIIPRLAFARPKSYVPSVDHDVMFGFSDTSKAQLVMDDPVVVAPSAAQTATTSPDGTASSLAAPTVQVDNAAQTTAALPIQPTEPTAPAPDPAPAPSTEATPTPSTTVITPSTPSDDAQVIKPTEPPKTV